MDNAVVATRLLDLLVKCYLEGDSKAYLEVAELVNDPQAWQYVNVLLDLDLTQAYSNPRLLQISHNFASTLLTNKIKESWSNTDDKLKAEIREMIPHHLRQLCSGSRDLSRYNKSLVSNLASAFATTAIADNALEELFQKAEHLLSEGEALATFHILEAIPERAAKINMSRNAQEEFFTTVADALPRILSLIEGCLATTGIALSRATQLQMMALAHTLDSSAVMSQIHSMEEPATSAHPLPLHTALEMLQAEVTEYDVIVVNTALTCAEAWLNREFLQWSGIEISDYLDQSSLIEHLVEMLVVPAFASTASGALVSLIEESLISNQKLVTVVAQLASIGNALVRQCIVTLCPPSQLAEDVMRQYASELSTEPAEMLPISLVVRKRIYLSILPAVIAYTVVAANLVEVYAFQLIQLSTATPQSVNLIEITLTLSAFPNRTKVAFAAIESFEHLQDVPMMKRLPEFRAPLFSKVLQVLILQIAHKNLAWSWLVSQEGWLHMHLVSKVKPSEIDDSIFFEAPLGSQLDEKIVRSLDLISTIDDVSLESLSPSASAELDSIFGLGTIERVLIGMPAYNAGALASHDETPASTNRSKSSLRKGQEMGRIILFDDFEEPTDLEQFERRCEHVVTDVFPAVGIQMVLMLLSVLPDVDRGQADGSSSVPFNGAVAEVAAAASGTGQTTSLSQTTLLLEELPRFVQNLLPFLENWVHSRDPGQDGSFGAYLELIRAALILLNPIASSASKRFAGGDDASSRDVITKCMRPMLNLVMDLDSISSMPEDFVTIIPMFFASYSWLFADNEVISVLAVRAVMAFATIRHATSPSSSFKEITSGPVWLSHVSTADASTKIHPALYYLAQLVDKLAVTLARPTVLSSFLASLCLPALVLPDLQQAGHPSVSLASAVDESMNLVDAFLARGYSPMENDILIMMNPATLRNAISDPAAFDASDIPASYEAVAGMVELRDHLPLSPDRIPEILDSIAYLYNGHQTANGADASGPLADPLFLATVVRSIAEVAMACPYSLLKVYLLRFTVSLANEVTDRALMTLHDISVTLHSATSHVEVTPGATYPVMPPSSQLRTTLPLLSRALLNLAARFAIFRVLAVATSRDQHEQTVLDEIEGTQPEGDQAITAAFGEHGPPTKDLCQRLDEDFMLRTIGNLEELSASLRIHPLALVFSGYWPVVATASTQVIPQLASIIRYHSDGADVFSDDEIPVSLTVGRMCDPLLRIFDFDYKILLDRATEITHTLSDLVESLCTHADIGATHQILLECLSQAFSCFGPKLDNAIEVLGRPMHKAAKAFVDAALRGPTTAPVERSYYGDATGDPEPESTVGFAVPSPACCVMHPDHIGAFFSMCSAFLSYTEVVHVEQESGSVRQHRSKPLTALWLHSNGLLAPSLQLAALFFIHGTVYRTQIRQVIRFVSEVISSVERFFTRNGQWNPPSEIIGLFFSEHIEDAEQAFAHLSHDLKDGNEIEFAAEALDGLRMALSTSPTPSGALAASVVNIIRSILFGMAGEPDVSTDVMSWQSELLFKWIVIIGPRCASIIVSVLASSRFPSKPLASELMKRTDVEANQLISDLAHLCVAVALRARQSETTESRAIGKFKTFVSDFSNVLRSSVDGFNELFVCFAGE